MGSAGFKPEGEVILSILFVIVVVDVLVITVLAVRWFTLARRHSKMPKTNAPAIRSPVEQSPSGARLQVFVSYSRLDEVTVDRVVQEIEQAGCLVWIDRGPLNGVQRYAARIVRAIRSSQVVALMCSRNAFQSDHVIREIYVAGDHKKPFLLFQLDPCEFPDEILYFVSGFPRVPLDSIGPGQVRSEIARLMASRADSDPSRLDFDARATRASRDKLENRNDERRLRQ